MGGPASSFPTSLPPRPNAADTTGPPAWELPPTSWTPGPHPPPPSGPPIPLLRDRATDTTAAGELNTWGPGDSEAGLSRPVCAPGGATVNPPTHLATCLQSHNLVETQQIKTNSWRGPQTSPFQTGGPAQPVLLKGSLQPLPIRAIPQPPVLPPNQSLCALPLISHIPEPQEPVGARKRPLSLSVSPGAGTGAPRSPLGWMCEQPWSPRCWPGQGPPVEGVGERMLGSTYVHRALQAVSCKQCHPEAKGLPQLPKACPGRRLGRHSTAFSQAPSPIVNTSPEKTGAEETGEAQGREGMSVAAGHADIAPPP